MIYGPVGLVRRHLLLGSFLLVPMVSGLAHAFEILCLLSRNSVALSYHYLTLTLAHSRVLLGVMLTVRSTLNESGRKFDSVRDAWLLVSYRRSIDGGRLAILHIVLLLPYTHHRHLVHWYDASVVPSWRKWAIHNISLSMVVLCTSLHLLLVSNHLAISL